MSAGRTRLAALRLSWRCSTDEVPAMLKHPGHYKVLFEGRVVLRLNDPRIADFGRPLLVRSIELIREIKPASAKARVSPDPQRPALLLWSGLHGVISLRINKPTLDWPPVTEFAEQITRAIIQPK